MSALDMLNLNNVTFSLRSAVQIPGMMKESML